MPDRAPATSDLYYDPYDYAVDADVHSVWKRMRDEEPLYWNDRYEFFALSRYDDVLRAVLDTETYSSAHGTVLELMTPGAGQLPMMIFMDPPEHSWHRKIVNRAFTARAIAGLEDRVTRLCKTLLDAVDGREEFDFLDHYGAIIPPTMILALMGFPEGLEDEWRRGIDHMFHHEQGEQGFARGHHDDGDRLVAAGGIASRVYELLPSFLAERRQDPRDDLMSVLVNTELEDGDGRRRLEDHEILSFFTLLSIAGTETVARLLGWVAVLLDRHPDQRLLLVQDPALIPNAIEECLRYEAPSPVNGRWLTRELQLHGRTMPRGSKLLLLNGSANRDERHFVDADRFDVTRSIDRHLSFGYGAHFCIGAALARLEAKVALREFLARYPDWTVDHEGAEMVHTSTVRGYARVPLAV